VVERIEVNFKWANTTKVDYSSIMVSSRLAPKHLHNGGVEFLPKLETLPAIFSR
jgi:hypothetical protein